MSAGPREGNVLNDENDDSQRDEILETGEVEGMSPENEDCANQSQDDEGSLPGTEFVAQPTAYSTSSAPAVHRKKADVAKRDDLQAMLKQSIQQREERARKRAEERKVLLSSNTTDDALYNFFMSMYQLTKTMPSGYQHRVRDQIYQAVSQAEGELLNMNTISRPTSGFSSYSYNTGSSSSAVHSPPSPSSHTWQDFQHQATVFHSHQLENPNRDDTSDSVSNVADYVTKFA